MSFFILLKQTLLIDRTTINAPAQAPQNPLRRQIVTWFVECIAMDDTATTTTNNENTKVSESIHFLKQVCDVAAH